MTKKIFRKTKKAMACISAAIMILSMPLLVPVESNAATTASVAYEVKYVKVDYSNEFVNMFKNKIAPNYEGSESYGYLFGGWYSAQNDNEANAIKDITGYSSESTIYAKYVPAYVMGVKCQNSWDTKDDSETTKMRIVSAIDSGSYSEVGLKVDKIELDTSNNFMSESVVYDGFVYAYSGKLYIYDDSGQVVDNYTPAAVFGKGANYFTAANLTKIAKESFNTIYCIQPYWITFDGTKVMGLSRYARVNDGLLDYINIPVNLSNKNDVAAGMLSIDYSNLENVEEVIVEGGTVFEEMTANVDSTKKIVKCVGNVSTISNADSNDIFVNLRVKLNNPDRKYDGTFYHFDVSGESFTNLAEDTLDDYKVWDIQY